MEILLPISLGVLAYYFSRQIRINSTPLYFAAIIISSFAIMNSTNDAFAIINSGFLGLSFFIVVMFTGAFTKGSSPNRKLRSVRNTYSILGFIFISAHAYFYILEAITYVTPIEIYGLIAYILIIPLTLISFQSIRKSMVTSKWIRYHRLAYLIYALIWVHLIIVAPVDYGIVYSLMFGLYIFLKLKNYAFKENGLSKATLISILLTTAGLVIVFDYEIHEVGQNNILEENDFTDGIYEARAIGYRNDEVKVKVTINNNHIVNIILLDCGCTPYSNEGQFLISSYEMINQIVINNRTDIDSIAGATDTTEAIQEAVINALDKAIIE